MSNIEKIISFYHRLYAYLDRCFLYCMTALALGEVDVIISIHIGTSPVFSYVSQSLIFCLTSPSLNDSDKAPSGLERKQFSLLLLARSTRLMAIGLV